MSLCYPAVMAVKPTVAIVGPGRLGTALALQLSRAGYRIREIVCRSAPKPADRALARRVKAQVAAAANAALDANLTWFCVPDREITRVADQLSGRDWSRKIAFHSSGTLTSDELESLRKKGASTASVHPLMTFVRGSVPSLAGVGFAIEGNRAAVASAVRIVHDLGGEPFRISKKNKAAYHAWGGFTSPLLIALLATAEDVAGAAGISRAGARKRMLPILRQTIENYAKFGAAGAFSGPIVRGDSEVMRKHLAILRDVPEARDAYIALARSALKYLPSKNRAALENALRTRRSTI